MPIKSAGSRSGRKLQPLKAGLNRRRHRFDRQRFRQTGHAFEQDVTIREKPQQQPINEIFLADNDVADLLAQRRNPCAELLHFVSDFLR